MRRKAALAGLLALGLLAGCSGGGGTGSTLGPASSAPAPAPGTAPPGLAGFYTQHVSWHSCSGHSGFDCTSIEVPLDYAHPTGQTIKLAVNRLPSTGSHRLGSLLTNPGGPGGSGLDYVYGLGRGGVTAKLRSAYDVIGVDPRGVGQSSPVECLDDQQQDAWYAHELSPATTAQEAELRTISQQWAAACQAHSGTVMKYVGTVNAARDMDVVRSVLGDAKLNYLGVSYGTELGQVYAQLFPKTVGRMVLDSVVDTDESATDASVTQMKGVQQAFDSFVQDCLTKESDCPLGGQGTTGAQADAKIQKLLGSMAARPLPGSGGRTVNDSDARTGLLMATYDPSFWTYARQGLQLAFNGDGSMLQLLSDSYRERDQSGHYSNLQAANLVIACLETKPADRTEKATLAAIAAQQKVAPLLANVDTGLPCAYMKLPFDAVPRDMTAAGAPPILLLNNLGDNATPIAWARAVAARIKSSVLVTNDESGHGVYGRGSCVNSAVDGFLVDGTMPARGTTCQDRGSLT